MSDPLDHATGLEKREMLAKQAGNDNPFDMKVFKRGPGTKENPNLIPSAFDARLVGCICKLLKSCSCLGKTLKASIFVFFFCFITGEEDQTFVQWMWLHQVSDLEHRFFI